MWLSGESSSVCSEVIGMMKRSVLHSQTLSSPYTHPIPTFCCIEDEAHTEWGRATRCREREIQWGETKRGCKLTTYFDTSSTLAIAITWDDKLPFSPLIWVDSPLHIYKRALTNTQYVNFCLELAQLLGDPSLVWSCRMKEDFLEAVTFKLRPNIFPGKLELEERGAWEIKSSTRMEHLVWIPGNMQ